MAVVSGKGDGFVNPTLGIGPVLACERQRPELCKVLETESFQLQVVLLARPGR